ncbi:MAG: hypothetical protein ACKVP3_05270 [Hyphomicrobiaceae bacterium]
MAGLAVRSGGRAGAILAALWLLAGCVLWPVPAAAQKFLGGVVDYAGILSPADINRLQTAAGTLAPRIGTDLFVITVNDREPLWAALGTHRSMVEKAFRDLETARARHYGANQKLTVLVVFKSSVVLHLYTNRKTLEQTLLLNNFYGGLRTTELKIRRQNESHADAATRYLGAFNASATSGLPSQVRDEILNFIGRYALLLSRELWEPLDKVPGFGPAYTNGLLRFSAIFASVPFLPGYAGFLLFCVLVYALIKGGAQAIGGLLRLAIGYGGALLGRIMEALRLSVPSMFVAAGNGLKAGVTAGVEWVAELLLLAPVVALVFSVANYDVENMLYLHQAFRSDLLQHLEWAREISSVSPDIGWPVIGMAALVVAGLECVKFSQQKSELPTSLNVLVFIAKLVGAVILTISTGIFTGIVAACFIVTIIAFQVWDIFKPVGGASVAEAEGAGVKG